MKTSKFYFSMRCLAIMMFVIAAIWTHNSQASIFDWKLNTEQSSLRKKGAELEIEKEIQWVIDYELSMTAY